MNEGRQQFWKWANRAVAGALSMALAAAAGAAPPMGRGTMPAGLHPGDSGGGRLNGLAMGLAMRATGDRPLAPKLDLRAPADLVAASNMTGESHTLAVGAPAFPSVRRTTDDSTRARLEEQSLLGTEGPAIRPMSGAQRLATRFRREGLPVARLFESRSALVSLGLNQRGKPGIWLIQKLP
jgi:hypothetical protein